MEWVKSKQCDAGSCVEVQHDVPGAVVNVRNSTDPDTVSTFTETEWRAFISGVCAGEFDL